MSPLLSLPVHGRRDPSSSQKDLSSHDLSRGRSWPLPPPPQRLPPLPRTLPGRGGRGARNPRRRRQEVILKTETTGEWAGGVSAQHRLHTGSGRCCAQATGRGCDANVPSPLVMSRGADGVYRSANRGEDRRKVMAKPRRYRMFPCSVFHIKLPHGQRSPHDKLLSFCHTCCNASIQHTCNTHGNSSRPHVVVIISLFYHPTLCTTSS